LAAIHRAALSVGGHEGIVASLLDAVRDLIDGSIPRDVVPMVGSWPADLRLQETAAIHDVLLQRGAFGAERAAVDGMIGIALHVDYLRRNVLGLVAERMDDHPAAHRAVGTCGARLGGAGDLQL